MSFIYGVPESQLHDLSIMKHMFIDEISLDLDIDICSIIKKDLFDMNILIENHPYITYKTYGKTKYHGHIYNCNVRDNSMSLTEVRIPLVILDEYKKIFKNPEYYFMCPLKNKNIKILYGIDCYCQDDIKAKLMKYDILYYYDRKGVEYLGVCIDTIDLSNYHKKTLKEINKEYPDNKLSTEYNYKDYLDIIDLIFKIAKEFDIRLCSSPYFLKVYT